MLNTMNYMMLLANCLHQPYDDKAEADKNRYNEELRSVYGLEPPKPRTRKSTT